VSDEDAEAGKTKVGGARMGTAVVIEAEEAEESVAGPVESEEAEESGAGPVESEGAGAGPVESEEVGLTEVLK